MYSKELVRGTLTPLIFNLLSKEKRLYGYEICQRIKEDSDGKLLIKEGSLYPALYKLKAEGLLEVEEEMIGKRKRRYYRLSKQGKSRAELVTQEFVDFLGTLNQVFKPKLV